MGVHPEQQHQRPAIEATGSPALVATAVAPGAAAADGAREASVRHAVGECPLCGGRRLYYAFSKDRHRVVRCADCLFMMLNPQPGDDELESPPPSPAAPAGGADDAAATLLELLGLYRGGAHGGRLLAVGADDVLLARARAAGYLVASVPFSPHAATLQARIATALGEGSFDVCVLAGVLQRVRDPLALLSTAREALVEDGVVLVVAPSLDSWPARVLRHNWPGFQPRHVSYFDGNTLQTALLRCGFEQIVLRPAWNPLHSRSRHPDSRRFPPGQMAALARVRRDVRRSSSKPILSVIVPAYNEAATLDAQLRALLAKQVPGVELEVVIVESNSTDGTRQLVQSLSDHPRVRVVLEDAPRGKGYAVREGLRRASGDFILIQDADLEYDLDDYDALLEPLLAGRHAFVLGSRHGGAAWWKMRTFTRQPILSLALNTGHWAMTGLLNALFFQRLRDPFTMYKVFRRDCLFGLDLRCNRFDFDIELLVSLIRKGYRPVEIPVNYRSRSFKEGKKVSMLRDSLGCLRVMLRLRFSRIDPLAALARQRGGES